MGLGNPGREYADTRHNAGWWLLDELAARAGANFASQAKFHGETARVSIGGQSLWLLKPSTFMNRSGQSIRAMAQFYRIAAPQILIAHDELDLPPGTVKLKQGGGHGGHNGLRDTVSQLGGKDFWRLRIGIGHPGHKDRVSGYVLSRAPRGEDDAIRAGVEQIERHFTELLTGNFGRATQAINGFAPPG